ncbi:hypothetical protein BX666DRAFT_1963079 [Dichotomocladium elegans]|nr:hypothetical protein BX666DRAFT_1963079 [Dichotomocladium elegans]
MARSIFQFARVIAIIGLILTAGVSGQNAGFDTTVNRFDTTVRVANDSQNGFTVEYYNWYKVVTNNVLNEKYALVCCGQPTSNFTNGYHAAVNIPVTNVGIASARNILPYLELLNLTDSVKSIEAYQNVSSPCYSNITNTPGSNTVDLIFSDKSSLITGGAAYVGFSPDSPNLSPLQKASWLVYIALFFNREADATTKFFNIENAYECHKSNMQDMKDQVNIAWTYYEASNKTWFLLRDTYYRELVEAAGGTLIAPNSAQSNAFVHLTDFHTQINQADYVIDMSPLNNLGNQSYDSWLTLGGFTPGTDLYKEDFIADKGVYRTDGLMSRTGYGDWEQRSPVRPDLMLRDIIYMFAPTYDTSYSFTWMRGFSKNDPARTISNDTYTCNVNEIFSTVACAPHKYGTDGKPASGETGSSHLSTGGKAGISVGVILFVVGVALVALYFYRRHNQVKASRPFYRMNDVKP